MSVSEHAAYALYSGDKGINLFFCVVQSERGADGALYAETLHEGLRAVVTGAHGYAETVEKGAHVEVVDIAYKE